MTTQLSRNEDPARHTIEAGVTTAFLERFAERIGGQARVQAVFGEQIELRGAHRAGQATVVPFVRVSWGFGGGAGSATTGRAAARPARDPGAAAAQPPTPSALPRAAVLARAGSRRRGRRARPGSPRPALGAGWPGRHSSSTSRFPRPLRCWPRPPRRC